MESAQNKFIFDTPKDGGLNLEMLQKTIAFFATELNDQNQFLSDYQYTFLRESFGANSKAIEDVCNKALDILEYSGVMRELIVPGQILNDVSCDLNEDCGRIILEWL